jgi:hypothetical protein
MYFQRTEVTYRAFLKSYIAVTLRHVTPNGNTKASAVNWEYARSGNEIFKLRKYM